MFIEKLEQAFNKLEKKINDKEFNRIYDFIIEIIGMNRY